MPRIGEVPDRLCARPGAVAAPTAGLHFDQPMLDRLAAMQIQLGRVTLHVGAGTFQPVRADRVDEHVMHAEQVEVGEELCTLAAETKRRGGRIVAVGTTAVRSLETAAQDGELRPFRGDTRLFIRPGYPFRSVDLLLTNFHLPQSTLLMLVCAFAGFAPVMAAYRHAVRAGYRFFSYGDVMLISPGVPTDGPKKAAAGRPREVHQRRMEECTDVNQCISILLNNEVIVKMSGPGHSNSLIKFEILARDGLARRARLTLARGTSIPGLHAVGTYGTVKAMTPDELETLGAQIVLGNTFHLWLRPGTGIVERHGSLHGS